MRSRPGFTKSCSGEKRCERCLKTTGYVGMFGNIFMVLMKVSVGIAFFSTALLADSLYSALDVGISALIIVGLRISTKPPDHNHDFGHGKIEFLITMIFSVLTMVGAIALFIFALIELRHGVFGVFSGYVLLVAVVSAVANFLFYRYTDCVASKFESPTIRSLSIHSEADAISSVLVAASMVFAYWGHYYIGPFVVIIETVHLLIVSSEIFKQSMGGLLDESISRGTLREIKAVLSHTPVIKNINYVRSRKIGHRIWLNIEVEVLPKSSIEKIDEARHFIVHELKNKIKHFENIMLTVVPYHEWPDESEVPRDERNMIVQAE